MLPTCKCTIKASCDVMASENPDAVTGALESVLDGAKAECAEGTAHASSKTPASLGKIRRTVQSRATSRAWRRRLRVNTDGDSTWIYLNKQAAAAGVIALCSEADESPLGPITLSIRADDIEDVIDWFMPFAEPKAQ